LGFRDDVHVAKTIISQGDRYRVEAEPAGNSLTLKAFGRIDEDFRFQEIESHLASLRGSIAQVVFDLGQITDINSVGVRAWLLFVQKLPAVAAVKFAHLSETFLEQANIVTNMLGHPAYPVQAVDVPYFCASCRTRSTRTCAVAEIQPKNGSYEAPAHRCPKCGKPTQLDAHPDEYFALLKDNRAS
jgi:hypothetical protein